MIIALLLLPLYIIYMDIKEIKWDIKKVLTATVVVVGLAIAYYFAIAIPAQNQAKLDFEKQKYQDEQKAKQYDLDEAALQKSLNKTGLNLCLAAADESYWSYMKLNGTEKADGTINALTRFWDAAAATKKTETDTCFKKYPQD